MTSSENNSCGCKGIRRCKLCDIDDSEAEITSNFTEFVYCPESCRAIEKSFYSSTNKSCNGDGFPFLGIRLFPKFIDVSEELKLIEAIDEGSWSLSQSGRRKQDYGPKVNFKRQRVKIGSFTGLPSYSKFVVDRCNQKLKSTNPSETEFHPVELCNLEYCPDRGASIVPHYDDFWLWGDRLITLNLASPTVLTFILPNLTAESPFELQEEVKRIYSYLPDNYNDAKICVRVPLNRCSLVVVDGPARFVWLHAIRRSDIRNRRIAMTFRELSPSFLPSDGDQTTDQQIGERLIDIASKFEGTITNK